MQRIGASAASGGIETRIVRESIRRLKKFEGEAVIVDVQVAAR
jgi:hypothetical protein